MKLCLIHSFFKLHHTYLIKRLFVLDKRKHHRKSLHTETIIHRVQKKEATLFSTINLASLGGFS